MVLVNCDAIFGAIVFVIFGGNFGRIMGRDSFLDAFDLDILGTFQSRLDSAASLWIGIV